MSELAKTAVDVFGEGRVRTSERPDEALDAAAAIAESEDTVGVGSGVDVLVTGSALLAGEARLLLGTK